MRALTGCALLLLCGPPAWADATFDTLLEQVQAAAAERANIDERRLAEARARAANAQVDAHREDTRLRSLEAANDRLASHIQEDLATVRELRAALDARVVALDTVFASVRHAAAETRSLVQSSLVSAERPGRELRLGLVAAEPSPGADRVEQIWLALLEELTEQGRVTRFTTEVSGPDGHRARAEVTRTGVFTATSAGRFLHWSGQALEAHAAQPPRRLTQLARRFERGETRRVPAVIDTGLGAGLSLNARQQGGLALVQAGGPIGMVILGLGAFGLLVASGRAIHLSRVAHRMRAQRDDPSRADAGNPLGRLLIAEREAPSEGPDNLALWLDELVLREAGHLRRGEPIIGLIAAMAPLLGLLGTVTGMIGSFRSLTLLGSSHPALMAGGISHALVTTLLGLMVAVPLVLAQAWIAGRRRGLVRELERSRIGLVARERARCVPPAR